MKVEQAWNGLYPVSDTFLSFNNATSSVAQPPEYSTGVCNKTAISTTKINDATNQSIRLMGCADDINTMGRTKRAISEVYEELK
jgi:hypothetical protein